MRHDVDDDLVQLVFAEIREVEIVNFLQALVQISTVNPPGDVRAAVERCSTELKSHGFATRTVQHVPEKPNLIAEYGVASGPSLCFNAHLDVVPTGDRAAWTGDPFSGEVRDGRVYGRGALDDKASVTAQVMAGIAIARSRISLRGRLVINEVADEEIGGPDGAAMVVNARAFEPDFVIVGEPTNNRVCVGERGGALIEITVHGRTAHGALPWEGANAIEGIGAVIEALRRDLWPKLEARTHAFFHHSSASINGVTGGVKDNVVPDRCSIRIDRRFNPGEDTAEALDEVRVIAEQAVASIDGLSIDVRYDGEVIPASMCEPDAPVVIAMQRANAALGLSTELTGFSMMTDGRFFSRAGYPTIIYGPGDPRIAHVADEHVAIDDMVQATRAYAMAALTLLT